MIRFTKHAQEAISAREIAVDWIEAAVSAPDWIEADRRHPDRTRSYKLPPAGAADPPCMKPCPNRFPGESRDPSIRRSCRREMDPGFRRGSVQCCRAVANCVVSC